jgi:hypothetical protein
VVSINTEKFKKHIKITSCSINILRYVKEKASSHAECQGKSSWINLQTGLIFRGIFRVVEKISGTYSGK